MSFIVVSVKGASIHTELAKETMEKAGKSEKPKEGGLCTMTMGIV